MGKRRPSTWLYERAAGPAPAVDHDLVGIRYRKRAACYC
ncbi:MAG: hypothetical protein AVDCRST_MAG77-3370 [uncultured Chloroflexi bacterium]|uniref:Uncharacterized protein n=1 Tax=uncultured Chloroflexota bacterium TaxID=166587 RepID=A0A6J4JFM6_9CHLR|nr:MAG: hypothetical protein AVDCRST_MAG77-3370 [uncultured Chloroflexota bacterium]